MTSHLFCRRFHQMLVAGGVLVFVASCSKSPTQPPPPTPLCSLDRTTLAYGSVVVGLTKDLTFAISNTGGGTLAGTVRTKSAIFTLRGDSTYSLAGGAKKTFSVRFAPTATVAYACTLETGSLCAGVIASGTGSATTPICQIGPAALTFGPVEPFCTKTLNLAVSNVGTGTLSGTLISSNTSFAILGDPTYSLAAGQSKQFPIRFAPRAFGSFSATLTAGSCSVPASGTGSVFLDTRGCVFNPQASTLDFGDVCVGQTATRRVVLGVGSGPSHGEIPVAGFVLCPAPSDPDGAVWNAGAEPTLLPGGGGAATIIVTFSPSRAEDFGTLVLVSCGDTGPGGAVYPRAYILVSGRGVVPPNCPACAINPTTLNFGQVVVGQTKDLTIQVTNVGGGTLTGAGGPSHCPVFSFLAPNSYDLGPGQSTTLTVRYTPAQVGAVTTCSLVPMGANCEPITLVGSAVAPPSCALPTPLLDFGSVTVGQSKDLTFDIENGGGGTLCGSITESCPDFSIEVNPAYCIPSSAFKRVTVRFTPSSTGFKECAVSPGANCPAVTVRGSGI